MKWKNLFQKKYIIFYLAIFTFISLLIGTLVIGLKFKVNHDSNSVMTLQDITKEISNLRKQGITVPHLFAIPFNLMVPGLVFSGLSLIFLFLNLLEVKKMIKFQAIFYWIGLSLILSAMILVTAGEAYFGNENIKITSLPIKFKDFFDVGRFAGLVICITVLPLTTFILGTVWYFTGMNKK